MDVVFVGEMPFLVMVSDSCSEAGYDSVAWTAGDLLGNHDALAVLDPIRKADVVVEMCNASAAAKRILPEEVAGEAPDEATRLSLTMGTSATRAADWLSDPERLIGFGLTSPSSDEPVIQFAPALQTAESHLEAAETCWLSTGFETIAVSDGPGLVRVRILCCLINESASALMEGVSLASEMDPAMKLGTNYPYSPLEWAYHLGLEVVLAVMTGLFEEWGDDRYRPTPCCRDVWFWPGSWARNWDEGSMTTNMTLQPRTPSGDKTAVGL